MLLNNFQPRENLCRKITIHLWARSFYPTNDIQKNSVQDLTKIYWKNMNLPQTSAVKFVLNLGA
jgi:hypothetical protein